MNRINRYHKIQIISLCSVEDQTQGFLCGSQTPYYLSHTMVHIDSHQLLGESCLEGLLFTVKVCSLRALDKVNQSQKHDSSSKMIALMMSPAVGGRQCLMNAELQSGKIQKLYR